MINARALMYTFFKPGPDSSSNKFINSKILKKEQVNARKFCAKPITPI